MARFEPRGAGEVLRDGEEGTSIAHADVPGVVGEGQLRHEQEEEEEADDAAPAAQRGRRGWRHAAEGAAVREHGNSEVVRGADDGDAH